MPPFATRSLEPEILDLVDPGRPALERITLLLAVLNRVFLAHRSVVESLLALPRDAGPLRVLDVGAGDGDLARAIVDASRRAGRAVEVVALDRGATVLAIGRDRSRAYPEIAFVRADGLRLPFVSGGFDVVTSSLLLHHLTDDETVAFLRESARVARRAVFVNDLVRSRRLFLWTSVVTLFGGSIAWRDGMLSARRAFTIEELEGLLARAGLPWLGVRRIFGHRLLLAGVR